MYIHNTKVPVHCYYDRYGTVRVHTHSTGMLLPICMRGIHFFLSKIWGPRRHSFSLFHISYFGTLLVYFIFRGFISYFRSLFHISGVYFIFREIISYFRSIFHISGVYFKLPRIPGGSGRRPCCPGTGSRRWRRRGSVNRGQRRSGQKDRRCSRPDTGRWPGCLNTESHRAINHRYNYFCFYAFLVTQFFRNIRGHQAATPSCGTKLRHLTDWNGSMVSTRLIASSKYYHRKKWTNCNRKTVPEHKTQYLMHFIDFFIGIRD